jgi:hypothetical protein
MGVPKAVDFRQGHWQFASAYMQNIHKHARVLHDNPKQAGKHLHDLIIVIGERIDHLSVVVMSGSLVSAGSMVKIT